MKNFLIIGLGNLILGDDAVGPLAVRELKNELSTYADRIDFKENYSCGIDMLEELTCYENVIIIDSLESDSLENGTFLTFDIDDINFTGFDRFVTTHGLTIPILWELGKKLDFNMPGKCTIYGIITQKNLTFSEELSEELNSSFKIIINNIKEKTMLDLDQATRD